MHSQGGERRSLHNIVEESAEHSEFGTARGVLCLLCACAVSTGTLQGANPELFVFSRQKSPAMATGSEKFVGEQLKLSQREPFKKPQQARGVEGERLAAPMCRAF
jgi:hypothetical protein